MALKRTPRPRDPIQLGKLMVDIAIGQVPDAVDDGKDAEVASLGRLGGLRGGLARAKALSPETRQQISSNAAKKRWAKKQTTD